MRLASYRGGLRAERCGCEVLGVPMCCVCAFDLPVVARQRSGWTNAQLTALVVRRLAAVVKKEVPDHQCVLLLDALRAHFAPVVLDAFSRNRILPVAVPALCTDVIQPLDTHVFTAFKHRLREVYGELLHESANASIADFIGCVRTAIENVLCGRDWAHSFAQNGFDWQQANVSEKLSAFVGKQPVCSDALSLTQVEMCLSRKSCAAAAMVWRRFLTTPLLCPSGAAMSSDAVVRESVLGKTRSQSRALLAKG